MNPSHVKELLDRAAAGVEPTETDPAARLVDLGRRSVRRRRRAWGTAGVAAVAAAVAAVVALPYGAAGPDRSEPAAVTVRLGGLSVAVPEGWRTSEVDTFYLCTAEPHTVYLATRWEGSMPGDRLRNCASQGQAWIAIVQEGVARFVNPDRVVVKNGQLIQVDNPEPAISSMWVYRDLTEETKATTAFISSTDANDREDLLQRVSWPAGPPAPPTGGLALPDHITSATTDAPPSNGMVVATDAKTLTEIRTRLAGLRDAVPAGEECTLQKPGSIGISLGDATVILGDAACPQAISTTGGRVRVPATLGQELLDLIVASDRAATKNATKN